MVSLSSTCGAKDLDWMVDVSRSRVDFAARHLAVPVRGRFQRWSAVVHVDEVDLRRSFVRASIGIASIDTGNADRDSHLQDLFEAARFPAATFESKRISGGRSEPRPRLGRHPMRGARFDVAGDLTIHGVTCDATIEVEATPGDRRVTFEGRTVISRKEFGLLWSAAIEWTGGVSDRVEIALHLEAVRCAGDASATERPCP